jgi:hypothetical protein
VDQGDAAWRLWQDAKDIEIQLPIKKRAAFEALRRQFPHLKYQRFGSCVIASRNGRLDVEVARVVEEYMKEFDALEAEARRCRAESDHLYKEAGEADKRTVLDPAVDPIPAGEYPKLRACLTYPLRLNCNYGENAESRWGRCEYMKYDDSKSIFDPRRWYCAAPE